MKEILFRGQRTDAKGFIYGSLEIDHKNRCFISYWSKTEIKGFLEDAKYTHEVISETIGQYTGLRDQGGTGKFIYEGDYFETHKKWFVEWQEDNCKYVLTTGKGYDSINCVDLTCDEVYYLKVKGNKHENI